MNSCIDVDLTFPVIGSTKHTLSISSPKNSSLTISSDLSAGNISTISPFTLNFPLVKSISFLSYWISTSLFNTSSLDFFIPGLTESTKLE